jgi:hypothetical protein
MVRGGPYAIGMRLPTRSGSAVVAALLGASLLLTGCASKTDNGSSAAPSAAASGAASFLPVPVSSEFGVGDNRVVFGLLDPSGSQSAAAPNRSLSIGYRGPTGETIPPAPMTFVWAIEGVKGVYVGHADFKSAGKWVADFTSAAPGASPQTVSFSFDVQQRTSVLGPGDPAPSVKTPTLADVGGDVARISTDTKPLNRFYETSEADAVAAHKPFVLIFATPKFCQQAVCGPTLDKLKPVAAAHPELARRSDARLQAPDRAVRLRRGLRREDRGVIRARVLARRDRVGDQVGRAGLAPGRSRGRTRPDSEGDGYGASSRRTATGPLGSWM